MTKKLTKEIPKCFATFNAVSGFWETSLNEWKMSSSVPTLAYNETYFDLAGLSQQEKTLFFNGIQQQDMYNPIPQNAATGDSVVVVDLLSSKPLSEADLSLFGIQGNFAGEISTLTFHETIFARIRQYVSVADTAGWAGMTLVSDNQLGSMDPTASDRIYVYRTLSLAAAGSINQLELFNTRFVLYANAVAEQEYQYLMRLKRSYELQQSFDVDGNRPH